MTSTTALNGAERGLRVRLPWMLAASGVALQVVNPLLAGAALQYVTIGSVLALAAAAAWHATVVRGPGWSTRFVATVVLVSLLAEAVGVATGVPFGDYAYADTLGPAILGVPILVPLAWLMLAYPAYLCGQALLGPRLGWLAAAWTLVAWDVFLDPQMVEAGHWAWSHDGPEMPGIPGIPAINYVGWLATAVVMMVTAGLVTGRAGPPAGRLPHDLLPAVVLLWTYLSQVLGNLVFWDRWTVAVIGGVAMGVTVIPYAVTLRPHPHTKTGRR